jgi:mannose-1-phosphate guanylyltransferase
MKNSNRWAIVLAGGEGKRLKAYVRERFGQDIPKQYCVFHGGKSMLEHTIHRIRGVIPEERTLTIIGRGHRRFLNGKTLPGRLIEQHSNRGTLPGILLGLAYILASDPDADVLILPADHYMAPVEKARSLLRQALAAAASSPDKIVLLGAVPDGPGQDYGWIEPGVPNGGPGVPVSLFREKPTVEKAAEFNLDGLLWNTMIIASRARTLWEIAWSLSPGIVERFGLIRTAVERGREERTIPLVYKTLGYGDFSGDILERASRRTMVIPMRNVAWSDWGHPSRIQDWIRKQQS